MIIANGHDLLTAGAARLISPKAQIRIA